MEAEAIGVEGEAVDEMAASKTLFIGMPEHMSGVSENSHVYLFVVNVFPSMATQRDTNEILKPVRNLLKR